VLPAVEAGNDSVFGVSGELVLVLSNVILGSWAAR
jgi:hypothetical protein